MLRVLQGAITIVLLLVVACLPDALEVGECESTADCAADQVCLEQRCRKACNSRVDCAAGETCFGGVCLTDTSPVDAGWSTDAQLTDLSSSDAARPDTAMPDAAMPDAAMPDTGMPDTGMPDTARPDTAQPDTARPDTTRPDHHAPDLEPPPPSCTELFGGLASFMLCVETADSCEFYQANINQTCDAICGTASRACITSYRELDNGCTHFEQRACSEPQGDSICVCVR